MDWRSYFYDSSIVRNCTEDLYRVPVPPIYEDWWTGDWWSFEELPHPCPRISTNPCNANRPRLADNISLDNAQTLRDVCRIRRNTKQEKKEQATLYERKRNAGTRLGSLHGVRPRKRTDDLYRGLPRIVEYGASIYNICREGERGGQEMQQTCRQTV